MNPVPLAAPHPSTLHATSTTLRGGRECLVKACGSLRRPKSIVTWSRRGRHGLLAADRQPGQALKCLIIDSGVLLLCEAWTKSVGNSRMHSYWLNMKLLCARQKVQVAGMCRQLIVRVVGVIDQRFLTTVRDNKREVSESWQ